MKRRDFLKAVFASLIVGGFAQEGFAEIIQISKSFSMMDPDDHIKDYLNKIKYFDRKHRDDVCLEQNKFLVLKSTVMRLSRLQRTVGHGNFYLLSFDDALKIARNYSRVGRFSKAEIDLMEMIFYEESTLYGFLGEKPLKNLTDRIQTRKVIKIPHTGNYLYKGLPLQIYKKITREVGGQVILTSGVRGIVKQAFLFLKKVYNSKGNLSLASRSLAPPGFSYHSVGDFDVGQVGFGADNFTEHFVTTKVYKKLAALDYIKLRYPKDNFFGVRFEPWHIKVKS
ncbi:D-alanyl-D-alanine carboxypeptidase family protein [Thermodesulfobacteriota bacterium]